VLQGVKYVQHSLKEQIFTKFAVITKTSSRDSTHINSLHIVPTSYLAPDNQEGPGQGSVAPPLLNSSQSECMLFPGQGAAQKGSTCGATAATTNSVLSHLALTPPQGKEGVLDHGVRESMIAK
jgi:hypothetical protein